MKGLVIKNTGNTYLVRTDNEGDVFCKAKGSFRLKGIRSTSPVVVGDKVIIDVNADGSAFITEIEDRKNYIVRRASNLSKHAHILAANIDQAFLFVTLKMPETTTIFIDRFLVTAEAYGVPVYLLFNKIDLYEDDSDNLDYLNGLINLYSTIGYKCLKLSVFNKEGLDEIKKLTVNQITLLAGHSGVGKSSLINELHNEADRRVGDISSYHHKGMHTTTFSEMIELDNGGYLIDTPGIKGFGTIDMTTAEVSHYFPEIFKFSTKCKYNNCLHINEPDCAVLKAIDDHYISQSRYASYLSVLDDVDEVKYR